MLTKRWAGIVVIGILVIVIFIKWQPTALEAVQVTQGDIAQTIVATGHIAPAAKIELGSLITATIAKVHVIEGDKVQAQQPLITLSDASIEANLAQAQANQREAEQRILELKQVTRPVAEDNFAQAQANLALAQADYARNLALKQQNLLSQSALDVAKKTLDVNQKAMESAHKQQQAVQNNGITSQLLWTRLGQANAALASAQAKADQLRILAPTNATVIARTAEIGATAQPGRTLITLASQGDTRIEVPIDEKSMRFLATGQLATVIADAYPQQPFPARLSLIYPGIDPNRATVTIRLQVDNPPAFLRPDMTVSIEMTTALANNTLIIPTDAIHDAESATPWVIKIADGKTLKQTITTGIKGVGNTQVLTGLTVSDWVVTQPNASLAVRATPQARAAQQTSSN